MYPGNLSTFLAPPGLPIYFTVENYDPTVTYEWSSAFDPRTGTGRQYGAIPKVRVGDLWNIVCRTNGSAAATYVYAYVGNSYPANRTALVDSIAATLSRLELQEVDATTPGLWKLQAP